MKKARLRITLVSDGRRETVVLEFPSIHMAARGLSASIPLLRANGGSLAQKTDRGQMLLPLIDDGQGRAARSAAAMPV